MPILVGNTTVNTYITNSNTNVMNSSGFMAHDNTTRNPIRPSMVIDFSNMKTLDPRITLTRASSATRVNQIGRIETVAAGVPRFDYNPLTFECLGLLIEEQRTNICLQSENFSTTWTTSGASVSNNSTVSPDGNTTADSIIEDSNNTLHLVNQTISVAANTSYSISVYVKPFGETSFVMRGDSATTPFGVANPNFATFDLTAKTATANGSYAIAAYIEELSDGWFRCSATTVASTSAGSMGFQYCLRQDTAFLGNGTSGLYMWGSQIESGLFETSYIPTTGSSVTRNADSVLMTIGIGDWFNLTEGTNYIDGITNGHPTTGVNNYLVIGFGTDNANSWRIWKFSASISIQMQVSSAAEYNRVFSYTNRLFHKIAFGYKLNDCNSAVNGILGTLDTSAAMQTSIPTTIGFGATSQGNNLFFNGRLKRFMYYNKRLTDSQLQVLTNV